MPARPSVSGDGAGGLFVGCALGQEKELLLISFFLSPLCLILFNSRRLWAGVRLRPQLPLVPVARGRGEDSSSPGSQQERFYFFKHFTFPSLSPSWLLWDRGRTIALRGVTL